MTMQNIPTLIIKNGKLVTPDAEIPDGVVLIREDKIIYAGTSDEMPEVPPEIATIDASGGMILPGFIDLHVNGGGGKDITEATEEAVIGISQGHATCGTTGLLVAITGPTLEVAEKGFKAVNKVSSSQENGAKILGVHMEGPFVNSSKQGPVFAGYAESSKPSVEVMEHLFGASNGKLKIVTMSPELDGAIDVIRFLVRNNVIASIGHSEANYDQVKAAIDAGVSYAAHMYNALSPFSHRDPGAIGALLNSQSSVTLEIIADGHHVHPGAIELMIKAKNLKSIVLVSDATEIVGTDRTYFVLPIGEGLTVEVKDGRTWGPKGQLIGSVLQMNHALKNMVNWFSDIPLPDIVASMTLRPAKLLGIDKETGTLEAGKLADVTVLKPDYEVICTIADGKLVYSS